MTIFDMITNIFNQVITTLNNIQFFNISLTMILMSMSIAIIIVSVVTSLINK